MPVMVVGADTTRGRSITDRLLSPQREVRVFVTDPDAAEELRGAGAKVAVGDVSDDSHLAGACLNCFSVVLVADAASDERERAFASTPDAVLASWAQALDTAGVERVIWVADGTPPPVKAADSAVVDPAVPDLAEQVFDLDEARTLPGH